MEHPLRAGQVALTERRHHSPFDGCEVAGGEGECVVQRDLRAGVAAQVDKSEAQIGRRLGLSRIELYGGLEVRDRGIPLPQAFLCIANEIEQAWICSRAARPGFGLGLGEVAFDHGVVVTHGAMCIREIRRDRQRTPRVGQR